MKLISICIKIFLLIIIFNFNAFSADKVDYKPTHNNCGSSNCGGCCWIIKKFITSVKEYYGEDSLILDAGCGWGAESFCFLESGFTNIYSLDPDFYHIEKLRNNIIKLSKKNNKRLLNNINLIHGKLPESIQKIEIPNQKWSVIILKDVLHFMKGYEIEETLRFFLKNIKDDGVLYIRSINYSALDTKYKKKFNQFIKNYKAHKNNLSNDDDFIGLNYDIKYFGEGFESPKIHSLEPLQIERLLSNIGFKHIKKYRLSSNNHIFIAFKINIPDIFTAFLETVKKEDDIRIRNMQRECLAYMKNSENTKQ